MKHFGKLSASTALLALVPGLPAAFLPGLPAPAHPRSPPAGPAAAAVSPRHAGAAVGEYVNLSIGGVRDFSPTDAWAVGYACVSGCASVGGIGEIDHMVMRVLRSRIRNARLRAFLASEDPSDNRYFAHHFAVQPRRLPS